MNVEFTDRYGGRCPSWLRSCHGKCEAMGWYPVCAHPRDDAKSSDCVPASGYQLTPTEAIEVQRRIAAGERQSDGWYFLRCPECSGTGRVSWMASVGRLPRWLIKGAKFMPIAMRADISPPEWTVWHRVRVALWCSWGADLRALWW